VLVSVLARARASVLGLVAAAALVAAGSVPPYLLAVVVVVSFRAAG